MTCVSMTGFGSVVKNGQRSAVRVEIRCVNHRFAEFNLRMPRELFSMEDELRRLIAQYVARGRVDLFVTLEPVVQTKRHVAVDWALLDALMAAEQAAREKYQMPPIPDESFNRVLAFPGVLQVLNSDDSQEIVAADVRSAVEEACQQLAAMRSREGERISNSLQEKIDALAVVVRKIAERAPFSTAAYKERLGARMREWAGQVDEARLLSELAVFAERVDIDEELVRMGSHLAEARSILVKGSPVGRRLDFLTQELHREVNTIGAKSQDSQLSQAVVEAKTMIEQLREQAQNLE